MKKILVLLLSIMLYSPIVCAQLVDPFVAELLVNLENEKWEKFVEQFHEFAAQDADNAEVLYWVKIADKKKFEVEPQVLHVLAETYLEKGRLNKSLSMFKEYYQKSDLNVGELVDLAQVSIDLGDVNFTQQIYEQVLALDPSNFSANNFLGNYLYLRAERERKRLDYEYKRVVKPTRMEYAKYRNKLKDLYFYSYQSAEKYLEQAYQQVKSDEIKNTLEHIHQIEKDVI